MVKDQIGVSIPGDPVTYVIELPMELSEEDSRQLTNRIECIMQCVANAAKKRLRESIRQLFGVI